MSKRNIDLEVIAQRKADLVGISKITLKFIVGMLLLLLISSVTLFFISDEQRQQKNQYTQEAEKFDWIITDAKGNTYVSDGAPAIYTYKQAPSCHFTEKNKNKQISIYGEFSVEKIEEYKK